MKRLSILGSTGSIGQQTLDVVRSHPGLFEVTALACGMNTELLARQTEEFRPRLAAVAKEEDAAKLRQRYADTDLCGTVFLSGEEGLAEAAACESDLVVNAVTGVRGLVPTCRAIESGHDVALANKETLVAGGQIIMPLVREKGLRLLPVDSEHSAIFQCLQANRDQHIRRIFLTASGGPFRGRRADELVSAGPEEALRHPKWRMGRKVSIDSATMMNKGLEVIEAKWLFGVGVDDIQVLVHPESIVHSAVEFDDRAVMAQLATPDMRIPISVALGFPDRLPMDVAGLDFFGAASRLTFERPDTDTFRCLTLATDALRAGGTVPAWMNGANEVLVQSFLDHEIGFMDIADILEKVLTRADYGDGEETGEVLEADRRARAEARRIIGERKNC